MKTPTLPSALLALGMALSPAVACGSSSGGGYAGGPDASVDQSAPDSRVTQEAAPPLDTGLAEVSAADTGAGDAGCGTPRAGRGATCDACLQTNCESTWCTCSEDPANVDGGATGCLGYARCVEQCVADDAGAPTTCFQTICALPSYTLVEEDDGQAFLNCLVQYCAVDCGE